LWQNLKENDHYRYLGIDVRMILKRILKEIWREGVDWIHSAEDMNQQGAVVNMVMNFGFHKMLGFLSS
jgi:hypothetical protein